MTAGHPGAELLAEYDEGLLGAPAASEIEAHLAGCPACARTLGRLGVVNEALRAAPSSVPVPPDVAARLDTAIAAEHASRATPANRLAAVHPIRRRLPQLLGAAAAIGIFVVAIGTGLQGGDDSGGDESGSAETATDANGQAQDDAGGDQDQATVPEAARGEGLADQVRAIASAHGLAPAEDETNGFSADACGARLAAGLGRDLLGAAPAAGFEPPAVLVVVDSGTAGDAQGWVVPSCDALAAEMLTELTVAVE